MFQDQGPEPGVAPEQKEAATATRIAAVRALNTAYADATCAGDCAAWLACWSDDGTWHSPFGAFTGHDALRGQWARLWSRIAGMTFAAEVIEVAFDGDRATARVRCDEMVRLKDGSMQRYAAQYDDAMLRSIDGWKFTRRVYTLLA